MKPRKIVVMIMLSIVISCILGCAVLTPYGSYTSKGKSAMQSGRFALAIQHYLRALDSKPGYEPALRGLEEAARGYYQEQMRNIQFMQDSENWSSATRQIEDCLSVLRRVKLHDVNFPTAQEIHNLQEMLTAGNQKLAQDTYSGGVKSLNSRNYRDAINQFEKCIGYAGNYKDARDLRDKSKQALAEELYISGVKSLEKQSCLEALGQFEEVDLLVPNYKDVDSKIQKAREALASKHYEKACAIMAEAGENLSVKPYRQAMGCLQECMKYAPNYKDAPLKYQQVRERAILKVVILPFDCSSSDAGDLLTQQLISIALRQKPEMVTFVDRQVITSFLISERDMAHMGLNAQNAVQIARVANAHGIVAGKMFMTQNDRPETSDSKTGTYSVSYKDSQGNSRSREQTYTYLVHTKSRDVNVQVSYQLINAETGIIILADNMSSKLSDHARWVTAADTSTANRAAELERSNPDHTGYKELMTHDELRQKAIDDICNQLASRLISNLDVLVQ